MDERPSLRPKAMILFLGAAVAVTASLVLATVGWYVAVQTKAGAPKGGQAVLRFESTCDAAARDVIAARLADFGLPATPLPEGLGFTTTLPGLPDDLTHMPSVLAAPGVLEVRVNGAVVPVQIENVGVQLAFSGTPVTLVMLKAPLPKDGVEVSVDGQAVEVEGVNGQELQLAARAGQSVEALRTATDRSVEIRHPLPCAVKVTGAEAK